MFNAVHHIDFAFVSVIVFFVFFLSLIFYLRREDRREGYPLEEDASGRVRTAGGFLFSANPKTFLMPAGQADVTVPNKKRDARVLAARRLSVTPGSPIEPTGNGMIDGIGPGAYAQRANVPDMVHGYPKLAPMRLALDFAVAKGDPDPRGMPVRGTDELVAGTVSDIWVDRPEAMIRYLEVTLPGGSAVLLPMTMAKLRRSRGDIFVDAITAAQFADVPKLASSDQVTFYEEERVVAYYGGGFLYANPMRTEPLV